MKKGQILVELDTLKLNDQVEALGGDAFALGERQVAQAVATVKEAEGNLARL